MRMTSAATPSEGYAGHLHHTVKDLKSSVKVRDNWLSQPGG